MTIVRWIAALAFAGSLAACGGKSDTEDDDRSTAPLTMTGTDAATAGPADTSPPVELTAVEPPAPAQSPSTLALELNSPATNRGPTGAIAVALAGDVVYAGIAYAAADRPAAEQLAVQICDKVLADNGVTGQGSACAAQLYFTDACGALAIDDHGAFGTGWGDDRATACGYAEQSCKDFSEKGCEGAFYVCSPQGVNGNCAGDVTLYDQQ